MSEIAARALRSLPVLYENVDGRVEALCAEHSQRLRCARGCAGCCVDDITVHEIEAAHIREAVGSALQAQAPGPTGGCAFLDANLACRIYPVRPYVCRTQGLPLRWIDAATEHRDICPLNEPGQPLESLAPEACWTIGPVEERLSLLQSLRPTSSRVTLRSLFNVLSTSSE